MTKVVVGKYTKETLLSVTRRALAASHLLVQMLVHGVTVLGDERASFERAPILIDVRVSLHARLHVMFETGRERARNAVEQIFGVDVLTIVAPVRCRWNI